MFKINRYKIASYILLSFLFFTLMTHYTKNVLEKIEYSADSGYLEYGSIYDLEDEFVLKFANDRDMVTELKKMYSSFTLIKREGSLYGVYIFNDEWNIPLEEGRIFTTDEMENNQQFIISNKDDGSGTLVGKPLTNESRVFVNLFSLSRKMMTTITNKLDGYYIINVNVGNRIIYNNANLFVDTPLQKIYKKLFLIFFVVGALQLFISMYSIEKNKIAVLKLCGKDNFEILKNYYISGVLIVIISFASGILIYALKYPQFLRMKLFMADFTYYLALTYLMTIPITMAVNLVVTIYVIRAKPIDLLRRMEE